MFLRSLIIVCFCGLSLATMCLFVGCSPAEYKFCREYCMKVMDSSNREKNNPVILDNLCKTHRSNNNICRLINESSCKCIFLVKIKGLGKQTEEPKPYKKYGGKNGTKIQ